MKMIVAFAFALVAIAAAGPVDPVKILRSEFEANPEGGYVSNFETENGIFRSETGELKEVENEEGKPQKVVVIRGSYAYPGEDGKPVSVTYYADESGYHAEGDSIPKVVSRR